MKRILNKKIIIVSVSLIMFLPSLAFSSNVYIDSEHQDFYVGDSIVFNVHVDSEGKDINVVEGNISLEYLPGTAHVNNLILADSGFSLWPQKPSLSGDGKKISFVGGTTQGLNSKDAVVFKIILNLEKEGQIILNPNNFSIYLNDGDGTRDTVKMDKLIINVLPKNPENQATNDWHNIVSTDKKSPEPFEITVGQNESIFDGQKFLSFNTVDDESGVAYYEVRENDLPVARSSNTYVLQEQTKPVKVVVTAYDSAGNKRESVYNSKSPNYLAYIIIFIIALVFIFKKIRRNKNEIVKQ